MNLTQKKLYTRVATLAVVLLAPGIASAIGPQYQHVGDTTAPVFTGAPSATLNNVVQLTGPGGSGSGSVIGVTAPDVNGTVRMAVLTANHVAAAGMNTINFGVGPTDPLAPGAGAYPLSGALSGNFQTFSLGVSKANPAGLTQDLSIMVATVYKPAGGAALAEYNLVSNPANTITLAGFIPSKVPALNTSTALSPTIDFTQVGQGKQGTFDPGTSTYIASAGGTRGYQNNTLTQINGNSLKYNTYNGPVGGRVTGYFQPTVDFTVPAPNALGGGDGLPGDSGSPLFVDGPLGGISNIVTPSYYGGAAAPFGSPDADIPIDVPIMFDNALLAVFVGYTELTYPPDPVGLVIPSVPLISTGDPTTGSLDWALFYSSNITAIPEPGSVVLFGVGGASLLLVALRRRKTTST